MTRCSWKKANWFNSQCKWNCNVLSNTQICTRISKVAFRKFWGHARWWIQSIAGAIASITHIKYNGNAFIWGRSTDQKWQLRPLFVGTWTDRIRLATDDTHQYEYLGRVSQLVPNLSRGRKFFFNPKRTSIRASTLVINFVFSDPRKITENDGRDTQYVRNPTWNDLPCT